MSLWVAILLAQVGFSDDFEDGGFSQWTYVDDVGMVPFDAGVRSAGLIGNGFRIVDDRGGGGSNSTMYLERMSSGSGDQYARVWFRRTQVSVAGTAHVLMIHTPVSNTIGEVIWNQNDQTFHLSGNDSASSFDDGTGIGDDGGWRLLELATLGVGTSNGSIVAAVDTVVGDRQDAQDFSGWTYETVIVGEAWGELRYSATLDFDNYRAAGQPLASRVRVVLPSNGTEGDCVDAGIGLEATFPGAVVAPSPPVALTLHGATAYADSRCTQGLKLDTSFSTFFAKLGTPGHVDVWAETPDLFPVHTAIDVAMHEQPPTMTPGNYRVGCGCESSGALLLVPLMFLRRASRRVSPPP